ncbi:MAG TPA: hypothetical protein VFX25_32570 [Streptosporangiaceae bacterium]|nr:hypothetical protein [Streptosporangiaceae bacterium]
MPSQAGGKFMCAGWCPGLRLAVTATAAGLDRAGLAGRPGTFRGPGGGRGQVACCGGPLCTFGLGAAAGQARGSGFCGSFSGAAVARGAVTASGHARGPGARAAWPGASCRTRY